MFFFENFDYTAVMLIIVYPWTRPGSEGKEDCFHRYSTIFWIIITAALPSPKRGGKSTVSPESRL